MLCLRDARERAGHRARWLVLGFFGLVLAASGALLAARALRTPQVVEPERVANGAVTLAGPTSAEPATIEAVTAPLPATDSAEIQPDLPSNPAVLATSGISPVAAPELSGERAPSARTPSESELLKTLRTTPVSMFTTSWCPHCERARRFFQQSGVSVVEHDIDADARSAAELRRRSGGKAVPFIDVDGRELKGFNQQVALEALVASVERRLGVTGVKLSVASVPTLGDPSVAPR